MLESRLKYNNRKISRATTQSFKSCNSTIIDPEITAMFDKLNAMTGEYTDNLWNPLNLINWERTKYRPSQSENRIRIENQISLQKASDQKVRPRVKPIKRPSHSVQLTKFEPTHNYKRHYQQIISSNDKTKQKTEQMESEEEPIENVELNQGNNIRDRLRKYRNIESYIQDKIQSRKHTNKHQQNPFLSQKMIRTHHSLKSKSQTKQSQMFSKTNISFNQEEDIKIGSIVKKWKPGSKIDKRFGSTEPRHGDKKRYSTASASKIKQLPLNSSRVSSQRQSNLLESSRTLAQKSFKR